VGEQPQRADHRGDREQQVDLQARAPGEELREDAAEQQADRGTPPAMAPKIPNAFARSAGSVNRGGQQR
jgi:hypothetical protein